MNMYTSPVGVGACSPVVGRRSFFHVRGAFEGLCVNTNARQ